MCRTVVIFSLSVGEKWHDIAIEEQVKLGVAVPMPKDLELVTTASSSLIMASDKLPQSQGLLGSDREVETAENGCTTVVIPRAVTGSFTSWYRFPTDLPYHLTVPLLQTGQCLASYWHLGDEL